MPSTTPSVASSGSSEFDKLRDHLASNATVRREVENSLAFLLARANPSDRGARFVVGGSVEWIVAAAAWSAGILTNPAGHDANGFDLTDLLNNAKGLWSIKFSAQKSPGEFRLTNGMSGAGKGFVEPTVFIHKRLGGLVYIDPAQQQAVAALAVEKKDAVTLPFSAVAAFATANPGSVAAVDVPLNEGQAANDPHSFIKELLSPEHFPNLAKVFLASRPVPRSIADEITRIIDLYSSGAIDEDERRRAVNQLLGD